MMDRISDELIECPECEEFVHTEPAEGVFNQSLRWCPECDAVFFI